MASFAGPTNEDIKIGPAQVPYPGMPRGLPVSDDERQEMREAARVLIEKILGNSSANAPRHKT